MPFFFYPSSLSLGLGLRALASPGLPWFSFNSVMKQHGIACSMSSTTRLRGFKSWGTSASAPSVVKMEEMVSIPQDTVKIEYVVKHNAQHKIKAQYSRGHYFSIPPLFSPFSPFTGYYIASKCLNSFKNYFF